MGTFLRSYWFENPPKSTLHFSYSITIGISIQTGICCGSSFCPFGGTVGALHSTWSCFKGNTNCSKPCEILLVVVIISLPVTFCDESRNFYFEKSRHEMCKILNEMSKCQHFSTCLLGANHIQYRAGRALQWAGINSFPWRSQLFAENDLFLRARVRFASGSQSPHRSRKKKSLAPQP